MNVDDEWDKFLSNDNDTLGNFDNIQEKEVFHPEFSDLYISTQTKIGYLNQSIDLDYIFWNLPILNYQEPREGIIKKIMKINSVDQEVNKLEENIAKQKNITVDTISKVNSVTGNITFKDIRKITIGICKKDLINFRKKKKSAFYNCFATIIRIFHKGEFREIKLKYSILANWKYLVFKIFKV